MASAFFTLLTLVAAAAHDATGGAGLLTELRAAFSHPLSDSLAAPLVTPPPSPPSAAPDAGAASLADTAVEADPCAALLCRFLDEEDADDEDDDDADADADDEDDMISLLF